MLSAFTARPVVEFKQRDKSKIESILAHGDRILVGLQSGALRIYRVNEIPDEPEPEPNPEPTQEQDGEDDEQPQAPKTRPADLLREEEKFSRRPVQLLATIKEANTLLALSDGYVSLYDLQSYALQERLEKSKGAMSFAVTSNIVKDQSTGIPSIVSKLAVAVKRKILLWTWQDMELTEDTTEISLISSIKSLTWATGTKIIAGMDPGFVVVDIETGEVADIIRPTSAAEAGGPQAGTRFGAVTSGGMGYMGMGSWVPKPMATRLAEGELLLAKDVNTLFVDTEGKALDKRQIPWSTAPEAIGYSYPYLLTLSPPSKGALEARNPDTLSLLQSISLPNATLLHVPQPNISLAHAGKGFIVASDRCIWRMSALDYDSQIDELVAGGNYDEAISLLGILEDTLLKDKEGRLREIKIRKAQGLFDQRKYRDAMDLFSEAKAPPERVIRLYPSVIAGDLSLIEEPKHLDGIKAEEGSSAGHVEQNGEKAPTSPSKHHPDAAGPSIGRSMLGGWRREHKRGESDAVSVKSGTGESDTASVKGSISDSGADKPLEGKDLRIAVNELRSFLAQSRVQLQKHISFAGKLKAPLPTPSSSQTSEAREAALKPPFYTFIMEQPPSLADSTASDSKGWSEAEWEEKLLRVARIVDTALFRAYMMVSPSLAGSLFRLDNFCDPEVVTNKLYETGRYADLIDFLHGKKLHKDALDLLQKFGKDEADKEATPAALRGPQRTVGYLQQLPAEMIDLVIEFAKWPLEADPNVGMEIFLADTENAETLPRHKVLEFLKGVDPLFAVRYLEHVINEWNDGSPEFHQSLVELYLGRLRGEGGMHGFQSEEEKEEWKARLQNFLSTSSQYNKAKVFRLLPTDDPLFHESRAIVLRQMGQHKQALQIYVFQIQDYEKAEDYCNQIYLATSSLPASPSSSQTTEATEDQPSIYHTLLSLYLSPPPPHQPNLAPALELLSKHGARLPASQTLELIPANQPVKELESYFLGRIRNANSVMRLGQIERGLWGVERSRIEAELLIGGLKGEKDAKAGRNRRVVISDDRHCAVCHKRFGNSAIRVYPDNGVVHYGCFPRGKGTGTGLEASTGRRASGW